MNHEKLSQELVKQLRGRQSQTALSRRLGYRSNVLYSWEAGRRYPTAAEFLRMAVLCHVDLDQALRAFYSKPPDWLGRIDVASDKGVAWLLSDLRGRQAITELAAHSGLSRYSISRCLNGQTEPRLPDFLRLFDALSLRLLDFIALLVDVRVLPSARWAWQKLEAQRRTAQHHPWSQAVLQALQLLDYQKLEEHEPGWLSQRLALPDGEEQAVLQSLEAAGQIEFVDGLWKPSAVMTVDTRSADDALRLKRFWAERGLAAIQAGSQGQFSYNVFGIAEADLHRLRKLHLAYFRELRSLIAESASTERVAVVNVQLFALDEGELGPG